MSDTMWWKIVAHANEACETLSIDGRNVYVRGKPEFLTVVELPSDLAQNELQAFANAAMQTLRASGIESAIIVPQGVRFVKLEPADPVIHALLEERDRATRDPIKN